MDSDWGIGQDRALTGSGGRARVKTLGEAGDPLAILQRIVEQAILLVAGAEGSAVELAGAEGLAYAATAGLLSGFVGVRLPQEGSLSGLAISSGLVLVSEDTHTDDRVNSEVCRRLGIRSMVCVPLGVGERPVGVLKVASSMAGSFGHHDVGVLSRLADFVSTAVAAALELARLSTELVLTDGPDPLRGAPGDVDAGIASFVANVMAPGAAPSPDTRRRIEAVLEDRRFEMLYQPVFELTERRLVGAEALARFTDLPYRPPDQWFADAERVGLGIEMELAAVRAALGPLPMLPGRLRLSVNVGPGTIGCPELAEIIETAGPDRVVIELTEHLQVEDYPKLNSRLAGLREQHTLLAIDDTGAGISSLTHVLKLAPDIIKLDREITRGVDIDPVRRALTSALVVFARESGARVVAEGIETEQELAVLVDLGVRYGQGFYLARPSALRDLLDYEPADASVV